MGIFGKIKNKLGIGGVSVKLHSPGQVSASDDFVEGKFVLTTKSEQEIVDAEVKFMEKFKTGRGDDAETKTFTLGSVKIPDSYTIQPGETKEISFTLPFQMVKSNADSLKEKGGALGALGSLSKFANNEKSSYYIEVDVDVKAAVLDPSDKNDIRIIE